MISNSPHSPACILVIEPAPDWQPELQRRFPQCQVTAASDADLPALDELLTQGELQLLVADLSVLAGNAHRLSVLVETICGRADVLVILPVDDVTLEWELRDWGATSVVQGGDRNAVLCACRQLLRRRRMMRPAADM